MPRPSNESVDTSQLDAGAMLLVGTEGARYLLWFRNVGEILVADVFVLATKADRSVEPAVSLAQRIMGSCVECEWMTVETAEDIDVRPEPRSLTPAQIIPNQYLVLGDDHSHVTHISSTKIMYARPTNASEGASLGLLRSRGTT